jgi:hypothetical protein
LLKHSRHALGEVGDSEFALVVGEEKARLFRVTQEALLWK